ncbi:MAG: OB-fold domain-containing protein [Nocardioidaceae bacterium]|nr:OB-fold domain-containing protein [Nocardioidaceae bacterium]HMY08172.1 OB-fold domain-containing protein [Marmoricola sp.]
MSDPITEQVKDHDWIMARAEEFKAMGETEPRLARDPVNQPMINNWVEAIGHQDPRFADGMAPPAMAQVWTMYGLDPTRPAKDPLHGTMQMLDSAGFTSVLGTNCDQVYKRALKVGEQVTITSKLDSVVGPKKTGVGEGYFVTTVNTWRVGDEEVATMLFRVLKFKPAARAPKVDKSKTIRPMRNRDTEFFWEGTKQGELRISKCNACGELRHPPGPMCPVCHAADRGYVVASGKGTIYSFLTHHAPQLPGKELPLQLGLIELPEGIRMVGELIGEDPAIGDEVDATYEKIDDDTTLVYWRKS